MRNERRLRRLVVDERTRYLWSVRHRHGTGDGRMCREDLVLYRDGVRTCVVFRAGRGRYVPDGFLPSGCVGDGHGNALNLHEPGVVRRLVDAARERGLLSGGGEVDGWELFPAVVSRGAGATPGAPPDCPPGP
ncbi:hypothetical protein ABT173_27295 [Streptomyces sp. NPDC001795]|uniref:hypothetical protein n=1 Tax=unclassified Streptomyces TaxID=2593676 RepID=UPI0033294BAE